MYRLNMYSRLCTKLFVCCMMFTCIGIFYIWWLDEFLCTCTCTNVHVHVVVGQILKSFEGIHWTECMSWWLSDGKNLFKCERKEKKFCFCVTETWNESYSVKRLPVLVFLNFIKVSVTFNFWAVDTEKMCTGFRLWFLFLFLFLQVFIYDSKFKLNKQFSSTKSSTLYTCTCTLFTFV